MCLGRRGGVECTLDAVQNRRNRDTLDRKPFCTEKYNAVISIVAVLVTTVNNCLPSRRLLAHKSATRCSRPCAALLSERFGKTIWNTIARVARLPQVFWNVTIRFYAAPPRRVVNAPCTGVPRDTDSFSKTQLELITVEVIRFPRELSPNVGSDRCSRSESRSRKCLNVWCDIVTSYDSTG